MNNRARFNDLLAELSGQYADFEITNGVIFFVGDGPRTNEGQIKIIPTDCCNFRIRVYVSKMRKTIFSKPLDPDQLSDPEEQAKIHEVLAEVDLLLNGKSSSGV